MLLGTCVVIGLIFSNHLIELFRDDALVIEIGTLSLKLQLLSLFFHPMTICSNMLFQSIGENKKATFLSMLRSGILFIPILLILTKFFGLFGVQSAQAIADVIAFFIATPLVLKFLKNLPQDQADLEILE